MHRACGKRSRNTHGITGNGNWIFFYRPHSTLAYSLGIQAMDVLTLPTNFWTTELKQQSPNQVSDSVPQGHPDYWPIGWAFLPAPFRVGQEGQLTQN
jgi:hypothetical protein